MHCRDCGTTDPENFGRDSSRHNGYNTICKKCDNERRTARRRQTQSKALGWLHALVERGCQRCTELHPMTLDLLAGGRTFSVDYLESGKNPAHKNDCRILCSNCQRKLKAGVFTLDQVPPLILNPWELRTMAGMTVAELLRKKFRDKFGKPIEVGQHADKNPLEARVGGIMTIDAASERDLFFTVKEIAHAVETAGAQQIPFTDYVLVATPGGDDERSDDAGKVRRVLRVLPVEEGDQYLQYNCLLLTQFYECSYDQAASDNLYDANFEPPKRGDYTWPVLQDPNGEFNDFETGDRYLRRFRGYAGWEAPHVVSYTVLRDVDGNGRVDEDEVVEGRQMQFWDYERDVKVGNTDRTRLEFLYVEQDSDGYFRLYKGRQVPQEIVTRL